ncbi:hypothetical protein DXG01_000457, partial [Tephrocybe rancida]
EPRDAQTQFSSEKFPTVSKTLPILEYLIERWDNFARLPKFAKIAYAIRKGLEKIQKWYNKTDDSNMYFICLGLEPSIKLEYCKAKWDEDDYEKGLTSFKKV